MGHRQTANGSARSGFSLIEVMIYLVVIGILGVPLTMVILSVSRASAEGDMMSMILERNRSALLRITSEYRNSLRGTASVLNAGKQFQFTTTTGFNGVSPIAGPVVRYEIRSPAAGDNTGTLVRVDVTNNQEIVLTNTIDVPNSGFTLNGNVATVDLATTGRVKGMTTPTVAKRSMTILTRN